MATKPIFPDVQAWPDQVGGAPAPSGHNKPPLEELIPVEFREKLLSDNPDFLDKLDQLLGDGESDGAVHRAFCDDEESLGRCGSLVNTLRAAESHVNAIHTAVKAPYLLGGRLVDGQKNSLVSRILVGRQRVEALQQSYARKRQQEANDRRAREDEERRKLAELARENDLEAALPAPSAPVAEAPVVKVRSDDGATVSTSTEVVTRVTDYPKAFKLVKDDAKVREAIDAAVKRLAKTIKATKDTQLAGVEITEDIKINNR